MLCFLVAGVAGPGPVHLRAVCTLCAAADADAAAERCRQLPPQPSHLPGARSMCLAVDGMPYLPSRVCCTWPLFNM